MFQEQYLTSELGYHARGIPVIVLFYATSLRVHSLKPRVKIISNIPVQLILICALSSLDNSYNYLVLQPIRVLKNKVRLEWHKIASFPFDM